MWIVMVNDIFSRLKVISRFSCILITRLGKVGKKETDLIFDLNVHTVYVYKQQPWFSCSVIHSVADTNVVGAI